MTMAHHTFTAASAGTIRPDLMIAASLAMAEGGDAAGYFDLGMAFSSGSHGTPIDLIEAHKWFNIAAFRGSESAARYRRELADEMSSLEVAAAQRQAREWISLH